MTSKREAWDMYVGLAGVNHPSVKPHVRKGLASVPACMTQEQQDAGYQPAPWIEMPNGGLPFDEFASIVTPAANSVETLVLQFEVPYGWDGIVLGVYNDFTGPGFVQGSGNLIWRIRVGQPSLQGRPQRNYSNIRTTLGTLAQARQVFGGIQLNSGNTLEYSVIHALGSPIVPAGTRIICNIAGFYWPRGASLLKGT